MKKIDVLLKEEDLNKRLVAKIDTLLAMSNNQVQGATPATVQGTNNANGTNIITIAVAAGRRFIFTKLKAVFIDTAGPAAAGLRIGTAAAFPPAAGTRVDILPLPVGGGDHSELVDGLSPLLVVNGGVAGTNIYIYAPHDFLNNAANDAATRWFEVSYAGVLI